MKLKAITVQQPWASLLGYETADGRIKLIDGHLRQSLDPAMEVEVEVLDVTEEEARTLLLSIDPLAQLAGYSQDALAALRQTASSDSDALNNLWNSIAQSAESTSALLEKARRKREVQSIEKFVIIVDCANELEQVKLLRKFRNEGLTCKALLS